MGGDVLDREVVAELLSVTGEDDPELLLDLIGMFLNDAPGRAREIRNALAAGDLPRVAVAAHSLKGSSGSLGAFLVQDVCDRLQIAGKECDRATVDLCVPALETHLSAACKALEELRRSYCA